MEAIPRKYGEWGQFDRYCKLVLYHEAIDYLREMKCRRDREVSLDALSPADWDKLSTVDRYSCDSFTFSSHGYDLHIDNELVAEAFASLPKDEQSILILRFVLDLTDEEIGRLMGMSRSAVQRHRTSTLVGSIFHLFPARLKLGRICHIVKNYIFQQLLQAAAALCAEDAELLVVGRIYPDLHMFDHLRASFPIL